MRPLLPTLLCVVLALSLACGETERTLGRRSGTERRTATTASESTGGEAQNTFDHSNDPAGVPGNVPFEPADPAQVRAVGSPEVTSRLHSCGKMSVTSIDHFLTSRGLGGSGPRPSGVISGRALFDEGESPAALGAANYGSRVPEAPFASTAAISKMFDIYTLAAYDALAPDWQAPACPGVKLLGADGLFTHDGLSCLIGKPATAEHLALANDAIAKNPTDGAKIAVAALLAAAHTCQ